MCIAYLISEYPSPSHTFIRREVQALRARGIDVRTFSVRRTPADQLLSEGDRSEAASTTSILPVGPATLLLAQVGALGRHPLRYLRTLRNALTHRVPGARALLWTLFYFVEAIVLARALRRVGATHLHTHFANAGANVGYLASSFLGLPFSLTLHGTVDLDYPAGVLLGDKLRAACFIACVSDFGRAQAMRTVEPEQWSKLIRVRCGVEPAALPQRTRAPDEVVRFVSVGRLSPEKGQSGLIQAFHSLRSAGLQTELRLAGDGPDLERVRTQIAALDLDGRCVLLGRLSEADALREIADADVLVLSSLMEGLPVVLMEALALGVPVIAPWVAGIPELVRDGQSGLLYAPGRWDELGACMQRLAGDPALRCALGGAGRARVLAEFAVDIAIEPLLSQFRAVT